MDPNRNRLVSTVYQIDEAIAEETIAYNYNEVGINNLAELRCGKVQLGLK